MLIMIDKNIGVTYQNISQGIFPLMRSDLRLRSDGSATFEIENNSFREVFELIKNIDQNSILDFDQHNNICIIKKIDQEDVDRIETLLTTSPTESTTCSSNSEEANNRHMHPPPILRTSSNSEEACVQAPPIPRILRIDGNERQMIAIAMENETTIEARHLSEKINELNKLWTKVIGLRREISILTGGIDNNPIINSLISDVQSLKNDVENLIDDAFFTDGFIILITKELNTDIEIEGNRRKIGRMQIKINLKPLISNSTSVSDPITINNIDRVYKRDDSSIFQCGHVFNNEICWGNMEDQLINAFESMDVLALSEVIIRFIKNPNPTDSWGKHLKFWPTI